ncbi:MAG: GntR family transcriptional regulator [Negativicutes bacterium]|nr:GntR family transcriptional regulator [Negativicutes bacterium]
MLKLVGQYSTKAELVYQALFDAIIANKLTPGTRLIVKDIAEQLSVSDIPVREALKMLEATGLIETKPHAGAVVATPSPEWIEEVFVMRAALESMAIRTAIPFMQDADIGAIVALEATMKKVAAQGDSVEYARLNRQFHQAIIGKSPYPNLLSMVDDLLVKSQYGRAIFGLKPAAVKTSDLEHDLLIEAIKTRDADRAEAITRDHRLRVGRELADAIRKVLLIQKNVIKEADKKDV